MHPALRNSGGTVTATAPVVPCDASGPLGPAICASKELERKWGEAADRERNKSPWEEFTDKLDRAFARMGGSINQAVIAGLTLLVLGFWLLISASGRVPALAEGRSETGPAAGLRAVAVGRKALVGGWFCIAGAVITAGAIGHVGVVCLTVVGCALVGWGLARRGATLTAAQRGFTVAEGEHQQRVVSARAAADAANAAAAAADPDGDLGVNLVRSEIAGAPVPEPSMTIDQAAVLHRTGGVGIAQGSATAALLDRRGKTGPAVKLWHSACKAANAGTTDGSGNFTPRASVDRVVPLEGGDALLVVIPGSAAVGDVQLRKVTGPLLRAAGIRSAGAWVWDGQAFSIRLSNSASTAAPSAAAPRPAPADDDWA